ncbi:glutamine amidotransferase [Cellulomonas fimi]|uniref:Cytoplasmic protein n=1 Tax=Cellulomonas fimi TaxID=1708 RepID=A0A7Y0LXK6_CELFI|nr:glutamine amidotransferase [Cellulomonas fimi]NMR19213.1 cytoplasmic protein [Cellulomonas fimi]
MKVLLIGETWMSYGIHLKGSSAYSTGEFGEGYKPLTDALSAAGHEVEVIPNHLATNTAPWTAEDFDAYDVVILSDIPADTLLLHADAFTHGRRTPNRLAELKRWVTDLGGGLMMIGGFMSFSGFEGKANYHFSPIATVLPVGMFGFDDRIETPEGVTPTVVQADHPVLAGVDTQWAHFLGYNKLRPIAEGQVLVEYDGDPFVAVREVGAGRTSVFASDCSPHWGSPDFLAWPSYQQLWDNLVRWTANAR